MEVGKWTGNSSTVVISIAGNTQIKKMIVSLGENGEGPGEEPVVPTPKEGTGDGTLANPYNCVAASSVASSLESGQVTEKEYYVKGIISQIKYEFSVQYGTAIFFISDDGTKDNQFQVYNTYYLGNRAWVADDMQIKLGDEVIVCGKLINYNGTPETASRQNYLYSLNGITDGGVGPDPQPVTITEVTCAHAVELTNALADGATSTDTYAVTGYITEVVGNVSRNQQTFWMADTKDGGKVFEAYWANLPEGVSEFKVGCKVKIIGQLVKYVKDDVVTPEIKNPYVIILEDGGNTPEPRPEMGEWESTVYAPLVVDHALKLAAELKADEKSPQNVFVKGIVSEITEVNTQYGNATYYISDDGTTDQQLLVYRGRGVNGARFESEDALAVGDHVIVCGQIVNFKGETLEFTTGSSILSLKPAAVSVVKADAAEGDIYTIAGQRVPAITRHGLYIVGGKKVVK